MKKCRFSSNRFMILFSIVLYSLVASAQPGSPFPKGIKRIVFLGNSITYAGTYIADIEAYFIARYPKLQYEFINVGLPSETVSGLSEPNHANGRFPRPDLHERLARVLAQTKPDVVFACYGMNDGIYLPLDESRFEAYRDGMNWLHAELEKAGTKRIVFLTPPVHDDEKLGTQGYNRTLDAYANWLLAQRDSLNWDIADIHFPMRDYLEEKRRTDPSFKLARDGVHPGDAGHWILAKSVLQYLGENVANAPDLLSTLALTPRREELVKLVSERQVIMKDAWLSATGHKRPEMHPGLPLTEARMHYDDLEKRIRTIVTASDSATIRPK